MIVMPSAPHNHDPVDHKPKGGVKDEEQDEEEDCAAGEKVRALRTWLGFHFVRRGHGALIPEGMMKSVSRGAARRLLKSHLFLAQLASPIAFPLLVPDFHNADAEVLARKISAHFYGFRSIGLAGDFIFSKIRGDHPEL
jgi:hypothetical protein